MRVVDIATIILVLVVSSSGIRGETDLREEYDPQPEQCDCNCGKGQMCEPAGCVNSCAGRECGCSGTITGCCRCCAFGCKCGPRCDCAISCPPICGQAVCLPQQLTAQRTVYYRFADRLEQETRFSNLISYDWGLKREHLVFEQHQVFLDYESGEARVYFPASGRCLSYGLAHSSPHCLLTDSDVALPSKQTTTYISNQRAFGLNGHWLSTVTVDNPSQAPLSHSVSAANMEYHASYSLMDFQPLQWLSDGISCQASGRTHNHLYFLNTHLFTDE